jgi:DNA-binding response OmpR family regulator
LKRDLVESAMPSPHILVIDDSPTIRKMVECHLSEAGYRVSLAFDAQSGLKMAESIAPDLILLDHQLPGTTGDEVCRKLLESELTSRIPVVISSSMRQKAFARYSEFTNVVDQIPKPFTPDLLRSGVANALQTGELVVRAQQTGGAMPESVEESEEAPLQGHARWIPVRALFDFLTNTQLEGRLTLEVGKDRLKFCLSAGRVQAVFSPTVEPDRLLTYLPTELSDLGPLLSITLGEQQDATLSGVVRLLERSLSDPRRLRSLLRFQSAALTFYALTDEPGRFTFELRKPMPPMCQAFPLQLSFPALAVEGVRRCGLDEPATDFGSLHFARHTPRGGNVDRVGMTPADLRVHTLLDGAEPLSVVATKAGMSLADAAAVARGLELVGHVERRSPAAGVSILFLEEDVETARLAQRVLGADGEGYQLRHVRDKVAAQLLLRRNTFALVMLPIENADQEAVYQSFREHTPATTRFVGVAKIDEESKLDRLDSLGLDGVIQRPMTEPDLRATVRQLVMKNEAVEAGVA